MGISTLPRANAYDVPWDLLSAMGCVILLPIIVFVMIFEEKIMDGIWQEESNHKLWVL